MVGVRDQLPDRRGMSQSVCVETTAGDAMFRDYSCVALADATSEPIGQGLPRSNHEALLQPMQVLLGWGSSSEALIEALEGKSRASPMPFRVPSTPTGVASG